MKKTCLPCDQVMCAKNICIVGKEIKVHYFPISSCLPMPHELQGIFEIGLHLKYFFLSFCLYFRILLLWRSHPTGIREYPVQCKLTSTSAMAKGRGASTSASPMCLQTVTSSQILFKKNIHILTFRICNPPLTVNMTQKCVVHSCWVFLTSCLGAASSSR